MIVSEIFSLVGQLFIGAWCLWGAGQKLLDVYGHHLMQLDLTDDERRARFMSASTGSYAVWWVLSLLWAGNLVIRIWFR